MGSLIHGIFGCYVIPISILLSGLATADVSVTTAPRGIYKVKVAGKPVNRDQSRTYFGIQLLPDKRFHGVVGSVSFKTLTSPGMVSPESLPEPGRTYYVHILSGTGKGFVVDVEQFRQNDIVCAEDLSPWMVPGTEFAIRPHSNLADVFGVSNRFGLGSGPDANHADNVVVWDPVVQQKRVYYFHSIRLRWELKDVEANASQALLRFPNGLYIVRRAAGGLTLVLSGDVGSDSVLLPVRPGANVFSLPVNLSASIENLISSSGAYSVIKGPNANRADLLTFEESATGAQRGPFYYLSRHNVNGWREVGVNGSQDAIAPLDFLSTLILKRDGPSGYVYAEGSLTPGPAIAIPPDPAEPALFGELPIPAALPPGISLTVEVSSDLQNWVPQVVEVTRNGNIASFPLPPGQARGFYRLRATVN